MEKVLFMFGVEKESFEKIRKKKTILLIRVIFSTSTAKNS